MKRASKKRGKGRPRKAMKMRAIVVAISLYDAENRKLESMAAKRGESKSETVRRLIREAEG
jgi:predicted transcriptional regulator